MLLPAMPPPLLLKPESQAPFGSSSAAVTGDEPDLTLTMADAPEAPDGLSMFVREDDLGAEKLSSQIAGEGPAPEFSSLTSPPYPPLSASLQNDNRLERDPVVAGLESTLEQTEPVRAMPAEIQRSHRWWNPLNTAVAQIGVVVRFVRRSFTRRHPLEFDDKTVTQLEQRVSSALLQLEQATVVCDREMTRIEVAIREAQQLNALLASLESRMRQLTSAGQALTFGDATGNQGEMDTINSPTQVSRTPIESTPLRSPTNELLVLGLATNMANVSGPVDPPGPAVSESGRHLPSDVSQSDFASMETVRWLKQCPWKSS
jgi:hypothetical protein